MGDHRAQGIAGAGGGGVAHVLATVQNAGFVVGAFVVASAARLAELVAADFAGQTLLVGGTPRQTSTVGTELVDGTVLVGEARRSTLAGVTCHRRWTVAFGGTNGRQSDAASSKIFRVAGEAIGTGTLSLSVRNSALGIGATGIRPFAGILAHQRLLRVQFTDRGGRTVRVAVGTLVRPSTTGLSIRRANALLGRT